MVKMFPERKLRLLCADYPIEQVLTPETESYIGRLIYPKVSHMDFNISSALHFASKSEGYLFDVNFFDFAEYAELKGKLEVQAEGDTNSYDFGLVTNKIQEINQNLYYARDENGEPIWVKSQSKVVFSGLGADEVWGGYSRYKTAAVRGGLPAMKEEMCLDLDRIWHRNMGRDDRVISVNGKEARFPFLDVAIQSWMMQNIPDTEMAQEGEEPTSVLFDWAA